MLKYLQGDVVEHARLGHMDYLLHGCNCMSTMGSGVARQIKAAYPAAYEADVNSPMCRTDKIGSITWAFDGPLTIVNLYTQFDYGTDYRRFEYGSFKSSLHEFTKRFSIEGLRIGMPLIGCGLAGGNPYFVKAILSEFATEGEWTVYSL